MVGRNRRIPFGVMLSGAIFMGALMLQLACPALPPDTSPPPTTPPPTTPPPTTPPPTASPEGVTASQVSEMIADKLNTLDRDLTLWNIQPGLGTVMIEYGKRFAMAQLAAQAGDWGMAQYQIKEAVEIQEVGETTRPANETLLKGFEQANMTPLEDDILAKDLDAFNADVASALAACNACHAATGHPYISVQAPTVSPEDFLTFGPSEPTAPESSESGPAEPSTTSDTPLSWSEMTQMVDTAFDNVDRSLTLWNIQPGLGTVMIEYGKRFAMLKFAVDAGDWGMAQYQLKEQIEIQEVGETTRPAKTSLLKSFEQTNLEPLSAAIENQDEGAFNTAYSEAIAGCNACHVATGHPYVRVEMPPSSPQPFLLLGSSDAHPAEEGEPEAGTTPPPSFPTGQPTVADAESLIQDRLNTLDRSLALWNIQPGLGTVMIEYGHRFALARLAVDAGNWGMAAYQIKEATEIQEVGETTRPNNATLLKNFEQSFVEPINNAIEAQDAAQFDTAFTEALTGCNACHQATGHPFVVVTEPPDNLVDFLDLTNTGS